MDNSTTELAKLLTPDNLNEMTVKRNFQLSQTAEKSTNELFQNRAFSNQLTRLFVVISWRHLADKLLKTECANRLIVLCK